MCAIDHRNKNKSNEEITAARCSLLVLFWPLRLFFCNFSCLELNFFLVTCYCRTYFLLVIQIKPEKNSKKKNSKTRKQWTMSDIKESGNEHKRVRKGKILKENSELKFRHEMNIFHLKTEKRNGKQTKVDKKRNGWGGGGSDRKSSIRNNNASLKCMEHNYKDTLTHK